MVMPQMCTFQSVNKPCLALSSASNQILSQLSVHIFWIGLRFQLKLVHINAYK